MEAISEVTRKYYHTEAGYDASILLAQDKIIRGYPIAAAGILERLSAFPAARKRFGAQLAAKQPGVDASRRIDLAVRALEEASKNFPGASILLGGRQSTLDGKQDWPKLLSQVYPKQGQAGSRNLENWLMTGGQPDRNGTVSAGLAHAHGRLAYDSAPRSQRRGDSQFSDGQSSIAEYLVIGPQAGSTDVWRYRARQNGYGQRVCD